MWWRILLYIFWESEVMENFVRLCYIFIETWGDGQFYSIFRESDLMDDFEEMEEQIKDEQDVKALS